MGKILPSMLVISIVLLAVMATLGCSSQSSNNQSQPSGTLQPSSVPTQTQHSGVGRTDLLAPYKNPDGSFKNNVKITDESLNQSFVTGALNYVFFLALHPDLQNIDFNQSNITTLRMNMFMYQGNNYKSLVVNITNAYDRVNRTYHRCDVCVIVSETGDQPPAYVSYATLDGKDLLSTYPTQGLFNIPTRLDIPDDKIMDK